MKDSNASRKPRHKKPLRPTSSRVTQRGDFLLDQSQPCKQRVHSKQKNGHTKTKLFVLDTNVLMHDPLSLFSFEEHSIFVPMVVVEELDDHKNGMTEVSRNVRQAGRLFNEIISTVDDAYDIKLGIPLAGPSKGLASGSLFFQTETMEESVVQSSLPGGKADNQIISVAMSLQVKFPDRLIILVSKDINMRIKARALSLPAEDYFNDKVLEDTDVLPTGSCELPANFWDTNSKGLESWKDAQHTFYKIHGPLWKKVKINEFVWTAVGDGEKPLYTSVQKIEGKIVFLKTLIDHTIKKNQVWGITARNPEQNFALNLLLDPEIDFVLLLGQAGTGKTLLTLAAALTQTLDLKRYSEIIFTRVTVPIGEDIGFLPGTEEEKMMPWMGAFDDNLDVLSSMPSASSLEEKIPGQPSGWGRAATMDLIRSRVKIKSLNFMRGRTFMNKFLIIDEAQNLTPKQMKTLITRAGPGTKVVCMGNLAQIDTPYLTEGSSGLTYVVDRFKGWVHSGHITLQRGERSRLADYAVEVL